MPGTGHTGAAKLASGLRSGGNCIDISDATLGLDRLPSIGRVGNGSPEIEGGAAVVLDHVCGSGISIVHEKLFDKSAILVISDGRRESISNEFIDAASIEEKLIPAGGTEACAAESMFGTGIGPDEG